MTSASPSSTRHVREIGLAERFGAPDEALLAALERVVQRNLGGGLAPLSGVPTVIPAMGQRFEGRFSPRMLALLAQSLDPQAGERLVLVGQPLAALAAVLSELPSERRPGAIQIIAEDPQRTLATLERFHESQDVPIEVVGWDDEDALRAPFDRRLVCGLYDLPAAPDPEPGKTVRLIQIHEVDGRPRFEETVCAEGGSVTMDLTRHRFAAQPPSGSARDEADMQSSSGDATPVRAATSGLRAPSPRTEAKGITVERLLVLERFHNDVWRGRITSGLTQDIHRVVRETFRGGPTIGRDDDGARDVRLARRLFHLGYLEQMAGDLATAEALYRWSLARCPTAEAWTFYGWVRSHRGSLEEAMDACHRAIDVDPSFGNAYNDIGAYLLEQGQPEGAKVWLKRAIAAKRYAAPYFAYLNLARVLLAEGDLAGARTAAEEALAAAPGYPPAERMLRAIEAREGLDPNR